MKKTILAVLVLAFAATASAAPVAAPPSKQEMVGSSDGLLSVWGLVGYGSMFGAGVRYQKVIVPDGFLKNPNFRDQLAVEGGIDYAHESVGFGFGFGDVSINYFRPAVGVMWNFWLNPQLALYPKLDLAYEFASWSAPNGFVGSASYGGFGVEGAGGVMYKLSSMTLRAEVGSSFLKAGLGFQF
jgi:hypothetical protein